MYMSAKTARGPAPLLSTLPGAAAARAAAARAAGLPPPGNQLKPPHNTNKDPTRWLNGPTQGGFQKPWFEDPYVYVVF